MLRSAKRARQRAVQAIYCECRPDLGFITAAGHAALKDRLAAEDSPDKTAVAIGDSQLLARTVGLHRSRLLTLDYPEYTIANLPMLSGGYDFLIADRALHLCENLEDGVRETLRVLRPGGWYVHTTSILDFTIGLPPDPRRWSGAALGRLFGDGTTSQSNGGAAGSVSSWVMGRKAEASGTTIPTVETIARKRRWYPRVRRPAKAKLGVVAIARNEAPYLLEWIAHYRVLGFERIVIYDNDSNDASWRILSRLAKAGEIEAVYWHVRPGVHKHESAYGHAMAMLYDRLEWCLVVDLDEFLVLDEGVTIDQLLPADPAVGAMAFPWRVLGSAGHERRAHGLTIERFTRGSAINDPTIKSLVRPRDVARMRTHFPHLSRGRMVDPLGNTLAPRNPTERPLQGPARIHHYCTRSREEFEFKRARGRGGGEHGSRRDPSYFDVMDCNDVTLTDALRMAPAVRQEIDRLRRIVHG